jgi:NAD(P)-dependent dehydrogenase (short-subunit alcohol dehydrogenase family)
MTIYDPLFDVSRRVIVLTGACGLAGRTLAPALAERGAQLVLIDVVASDPAAAAATIGDGALGIACDVADAAQVAAAAEAALERFGHVDVLINAHQHKPEGFLEARAEEFPEELWDAVIDVNLKGVFLLCREFGRSMLERGSGSVVNLGSTYGLVSSNPDLYAANSLGNPLVYSASKGAVLMLTRYLAAHWAGRGVRVNCVTPHGIANAHEEDFIRRFSAKSPMGRMMSADELVGAVVFLASDASSYATGSNVVVDGGWTAW